MEPTITTPQPPEEPAADGTAEPSNADAALPANETGNGEASPDSEEFRVENADPNDMTPAENVKVSVMQVTLGENGKAAGYTELQDAKVDFTQNTVDDDGSVNADAQKICFKVTPADGKKLDKLEYALADKEEDFAFEKEPRTTTISLKGENDEYQVKDAIKDLISKKKLVRIFVTVVDVEYNVSFDVSGVAATSVYLQNKDSDKYNFTAAKTSAKVAYGGSLSFAVKSDNLTVANAYVTAKKGNDAAAQAVTVPGGDELKTQEKEGAAAGEPDEYLEYTLSASEIAGLSATKNDTIAVTVGTKPTYAVSLATANLKKEPVGANIQIQNVDEDEEREIQYKALAANDATPGYQAGDQIAFALAAAENYKLLEPSAYWLPNGAPDTDETQRHKLEIGTETLPVGGTEKECYVIDLTGITQAADLYVTLSAELDDEKEDVKTITFSGDGHAKVIPGDVADSAITDEKQNIIGKSRKTTEGSYVFKVQADEGYTVTEIKTEIAKTYTEDQSTATDTIVINKSGKNNAADIAELYPFNGLETITVPFSGTDTDEEGNGKAWDSRSITVTVTTKVLGSVLDSEVTFTSKGSYPNTTKGAYEEIEVKQEPGKVESVADNDNKYKVHAEAEYLEFSVKDAETEPEIRVHNTLGLAQKVEGDGFTYRIPAVSLRENDSVVITRKSKTVTANYNDSGSLTVGVTDVTDSTDPYELTPVVGSGDPKTNYDQKATATVNVDSRVKVTVTPNRNAVAPITAVTWQLGDGASQYAELQENGSYEFETKATDNITVNVAKSTDKKQVLTVTKVDKSEEEKHPDDDGVYTVSYTDVITARVYSGETALPLYNATVKTESGKNAATAAKVDGSEATLTINENERDEVLTLTLITLADRTPVIFKIKSETPVESVAYDNITDNKLSLPVDTRRETNVELTAENAPLRNLEWGFVGKTDKNASKATKDNDYVEVDARELHNGKLAIIAKIVDAKGKGKADAARIVLYDKNDKDKKIITGSEISVTVEDATVLGKTPVVNEGTSTSRSLRITIDRLEGIEEDLASGASVWYKVDVKAPSISGKDLQTAVSEALAKLPGYYPKSQVDAEGGISLTVIDEIINDEDDKPENDKRVEAAELKDFTVTVTPIQTLGYVEDAADINDGEYIKGTSGSTKASTQKAYYEDTQTGKLKLTTMNKAAVVTGNTTPTAVAQPQFDQAATYTMVKVDFVDMKTGRERNPIGLDKAYNEITNSVMVWSTGEYGEYGSGYKVNAKTNEYKDLGVKVTAMTEMTGYGVSGTVKLNVTNGIEEIKATAQPRVLKKDKQKTSFKVAVDLNESSNNTGNFPEFEKKYAPKSKVVKYEIVGKDTSSPYDKTAAPANIKDYVTEKNGTVSVDKNFVIDQKNEDNNKFSILVTAADYAGNTVYDVAGPVTIKSQSLAMNDLVIMKPGKDKNGGDDWKNASIVSGSLEVTRPDQAEYRAVVLQSGVNADTGRTYNVDVNFDEGSKIIIDPDELTFTPAKGNVRVDNKGWIYVKKFGKATITAQDKSDKKNKLPLKVEFAPKSTNLILELTQFTDSTFATKGESYYDTDVTFAGNSAAFFGLNIVERDEKGKVNEIRLSDVKIGFKKNVKDVTPKKAEDWSKYGGSAREYQYLAAVTGNPATITFQRKGQQAVTYTLTNTNVLSGKAPKVALLNKKQTVTEGSYATLEYELKSTVKGETYDGKYIMLSVDNTKANPNDIDEAIGSYQWNDRVGYVLKEKYLDCAIPIRDGSIFDLKIQPDYAAAYNLIVAVGSLKEGKFTQEYPDAKLTVKAAKKRSGNLSVTNKYTLDPNVASMVKIQYKGTETPWFANEPVDGNFAQNAIVGHEENAFRKYFVAAYNENGEPVIGLKKDLEETKLTEIMNQDPKDPKNSLTGFLSLQTSSKRVDVQVTMSFKPVKQLRAVCTPVLSGTDMTLDIKLYNGKEYVPVKDYTIAGEGGGFKKEKAVEDYLTNHILNGEKKIMGGDIRLHGSGVEAGKVPIELAVTPMNAHAKAKAVAVKVTATVEKKGAKNKVLIDKGAEKWEVSNLDYVGPGEKDDPATDGTWRKDIGYSFKSRLGIKENTPITVTLAEKDLKKYPFVSFAKLKDSKGNVIAANDLYSVKDSHQNITAVIDKKLYTEAAAADKKLAGKKITVNFVFTYGGKVDDKDYNPELEPDKAKLTITLPKDVNTGAPTKADFENVQDDIQNMIAIQTAHNKKVFKEYLDNEDVSKEEKNLFKENSNNEITERIKNWLLDVAGSATVHVSVVDGDTGKEPDFAKTYAAKVTGADGKTAIYDHTFDAYDEENVGSVISKINELAGPEDDWAPVKNAEKADGTADEAMRNLFTLTKDTTEAQYTDMIRKILAQSGKISNNIGISVSTKENGFKAPTVGAGKSAEGYYNVWVTVTDKNRAPSEGTDYQNQTVVNYAFAPLEPVGSESSGAIQRVTNVLKGTVSDDQEMLGDLVSKTWEDVWKSGGSSDLTTESSTFHEALERAIVEKAADLIKEGTISNTGNDNLTVSGIERGTFTMTSNAPTDDTVTAMSYTLNLTDSSAEPEKKIAVEISLANTITVESFQTNAQLQAAAEDIKSIPKASKPEEIIKTVTDKIKALVKNPSFNKEGITVTVEEYIAPAGNIAGLATVEVTLAAGESSFSIDDITILTNTDSEIKPDQGVTGDAAIEENVNYKKVVAKIQATLNKEKLTQMFLDMQNKLVDASGAYVTANVIDEDKIKEEIATIVDTCLTVDDGYELNDGADKKANIDVPSGHLGKPVDEKTETVLPAFNVKIKKSGGGETKSVPIASITLPKMPEFQKLDAAGMTALIDSVASSGTLTLDNIPGLTAATDSSTPPKMTGFTGNGTNDFKTALENKFKEKITNKLYKVSSDAITGSQNNEDDTAYTECAAGGSNQFEVKNWKVTIEDLSSGGTIKAEKPIDINIKTAAQSSVVKGIKFTKLDEDEDVASATNTTSVAPYDYDAEDGKINGVKTDVKVVAEVETTAGAANNSNYQKLTWKVGKAADGDPIPGVTISDAGVISIADTVELTARDHTLVVKVTATTVKTNAFGATISKDLYVKLHFVPRIDKDTFEITGGPETIELDSTGASHDAAGGTLVTGYEVTMDGLYLTPDDKEDIEWTITKADEVTALTTEGAVVADVSDGFKAGVKITSGTSLVEDGVVLWATFKDTSNFIPDDDEDISAKRRIALTKHVAAADETAPAITLDTSGASGVEEGELSDQARTKKITVIGKEVRIPLSVDGYDDRAWTYRLANATGAENDLMTTYGPSPGSDDIKVEYSANRKRAWLVVKNDVLASDAPDEKAAVTDEDGTVSTPAVSAKKITLSANATGSGAMANMDAKTLTFALVVQKNVEGVKLSKVDDADGDNPDDGTGTITNEMSASPVNVYLKAEAVGAHVKASDETSKISYKITNKTRDLTVEKETDNGITHITIPANSAGFVEVTATYKDGTGEDEVKRETKRLIRVIDPTTRREICKGNGDPVGDLMLSTATTNELTSEYKISNLATTEGPIKWSVTSSDATFNTHAKIQPNALNNLIGTLTIDTNPTTGLPAGEYTGVKINAEWVEDGVTYQKSSASFKVTVKKIATELTVTGVSGTGDLVGITELGSGITITTAQTGTLKFKTALVGERLAESDKKALTVTLTDTNTTIPVDDSTWSIADDGTVTITIPSGLSAGSFKVDIVPDSHVMVADATVKASVTVTVGTP